MVTKNHETLKIEGVTLEAYHWAPAHTSGDLVVYLPNEKIVFTGDIIAGQSPDTLIHLEKNGSSEGWITTVKGMTALNADQFVPGHGDVQSKAAIQKRLDDVSAKRAKIKELVAQGKSLEEIKAAVDPPPAAVRQRRARGSGVRELYGSGLPGEHEVAVAPRAHSGCIGPPRQAGRPAPREARVKLRRSAFRPN